MSYIALIFVLCLPAVSLRETRFGCLVPEEPRFGGFIFDDKTKSLRLLCAVGYDPIGDVERKCVDHRWTGQDGDCVDLKTAKWKYGCPVLIEPLFGTLTFDDRTKSVKLRCVHGFIQIGDAERTCNNGQWSGTKGDCLDVRILEKQCPELRSPNNGHVIEEGREIGDTAHFFCNEGFVLEGSPRVTCQPGKVWDGTLPICSSRQTLEDFASHLKDTMIDSLAGATADSETGAQSRLSPGKSGLDIVLLVDTSSSIGDKSMKSAKTFMKKLVDIFGVSSETSGGTNGTRFALITFSDQAHVVFNLDNPVARSVEVVKNMIDQIENKGGGTNFKMALLAVAFEVYFSVIDNDEKRKKDATRAVFIITDAQETSSLNASRINEIRDIADPLKTSHSFEIFSIGVGQDIDRFMLAEIASKPEVEHVFLINQFKDLDRIGDIIAEKNIDYGQCGISGKTEIAQGSQDAVKGAWPWLGWLSSVATDDRGQTLVKTCGGALLCDRWFMTAASCVSWVTENGTVVPYDPSNVNVYLSEHQLLHVDKDEVHAIVKDIRIHDSYTGDVVGKLGVSLNDIALLDLGENETSRPVLNKFLRPLCFPVNNTKVAAHSTWLAMISFPENNVGYTAGWGHSPKSSQELYSKYPFSELKQNERPLLKMDICKKRYPDLDLDRFFCVGTDFRESDTCVGDIGGPYMVHMTNKRYVSMGIALNTEKCDELYRYSIFLNAIHPEVSEWAEEILDGCNRQEELRN